MCDTHLFAEQVKYLLGGSHFLEDNLLRGFPSDRLDALRIALDDLKRDGIPVLKTRLSPTEAPEARKAHVAGSTYGMLCDSPS